jgi:DNA-binding PadR family transcriptional regulator
MNVKKKESDLDEIILEIVRKMQPISSEEVWMEIGENLDLESNPPQEEINQRLDKMEKKNFLRRSNFKQEEEKYMVMEK